MLVDECVARQIEDHLDITFQRNRFFRSVNPLYPILLVHGMAMQHGLGPEVNRDLTVVMVHLLRPGWFFMFHPVCGSAGPAAGNSHISGHTGKQNAAPGALFSISIALRSVSLNEGSRLCQGITPCQTSDGVCRYSGDRFCPFRRFLHAVLFTVQIREITL